MEEHVPVHSAPGILEEREREKPQYHIPKLGEESNQGAVGPSSILSGRAPDLQESARRLLKLLLHLADQDIEE